MLRELAIIDTIGQVLGDKAPLENDAYYDPESRLIYTTDMLVEGEHFRLEYFSPADLGWKAAAVNISDIAAMGGRVRYLLISLGLPETLPDHFIREFYEGIKSLVDRHGGVIIGGDTVASPQIVINVTAVGELPVGHRIGERSQAKPGDRVIATGFHGLSAVGLWAFLNRKEGFEAAKAAHLRPVPRVELGLSLSAPAAPYALMDSSDGLADAALKVARASGVRIDIHQEKIPLHSEVQAWSAETGTDPSQAVLYGGEDFELIATLSPLEPLPTGFTEIGTVSQAEESDGLAYLIHQDGTKEPLDLNQTYQHFKENA